MTAKQLKNHRKRLGMNQTQMAKHLCVAFSTYCRWEQNVIKFPLPIEKLFCLMFDIPFKEKNNKAYSESPDLF